MPGFYSLLLTRFLFGAGEAGAFPNASVVVSRWFPPRQRATMSGVTLMASQVGGAVAPLLVLPIQMRYGNAPFIPMTVLPLVGAALWVNVDASREVGAGPPARSMDVEARVAAMG